MCEEKKWCVCVESVKEEIIIWQRDGCTEGNLSIATDGYWNPSSYCLVVVDVNTGRDGLAHSVICPLIWSLYKRKEKKKKNITQIIYESIHIPRLHSLTHFHYNLKQYFRLLLILLLQNYSYTRVATRTSHFLPLFFFYFYWES